MISSVYQRYAKALLHCVGSVSEREEVSHWLKVIETCFLNKDFKKFVESPAIASPIKKSFVLEVLKNLEADIPSLLLNFLGVLEAENRISNLHGIALAFRPMYFKAQNTKVVKITSTHQLNENQLSDVISFTKKHFAKEGQSTNWEVEQSIDSSLLAGFIMKVDDYLVDLTIGHRVKKIAQKLNEN